MRASDKGPSKKRTASLERTVRNVPKYTFLDLREEDNLSIVDKMAGPHVYYSYSTFIMTMQELIIILTS